MPPGSAWTAFGFLIGIAGGGAAAAALRGRPVLAGRRCANCGASLSPWPRVPLLSWFGPLPRCPRCGTASPRLHAVLEAAVVLVGLAAIALSPPSRAVVWAAAGWALLLALLMWRRLR